MTDSRADSTKLDSIPQDSESMSELEEPPVSIYVSPLPVESRSIDSYRKDKSLSAGTHHTVYEATEQNDYEVISVCLKENAPGSYSSEVEAANAAHCQFLAPGYVPDTKAIYEERNGTVVFIGVASTKIIGFKPLSIDPLKKEDLDVAHLAERNLFSVLDKAGKELKEQEQLIEKIQRRIKKLDEDKALLDQKLRELRNAANGGLSINLMLRQLQINSKLKEVQNQAYYETIKKQNDFYTKLQIEHQVSKADFEKYRIVKGNAICFATSYITKQDDLHQNNMDKYGNFFDFDMSYWDEFDELKNMGLVRLFRAPSKTADDVTVRDVMHAPNRVDSVPGYWPTEGTHIFSDSKSAFLARLYSKTNAYPSESNLLYQSLEYNPVFVYHYFATLLKYVLSSAEIYKHIAQLHVREECVHRSKFIIDIYTHCHARRIQKFRDVLVQIPAFKKFIDQHGEVVSEEIKTEFSARNKKYEQLVVQAKKELEKLRVHAQRLSDINDSLMKKVELINGSLSVKVVSASTETPEEPFKFVTPLEIDEDYGRGISVEDEKRVQNLKDERDLQLNMVARNEAKIKKIMLGIHKKEAVIAAYDRQKINMGDVDFNYKKICGYLENMAIPKEEPAPAVAPAPVNSFYNLYGLFGPSVPVVTPAVKPNDYNSVKVLVKKAIKDYVVPPGLKGFILSANGKFRSQGPVADKIIKSCDARNPAPDNVQANIDAIKALEQELQGEKSKLTKGSMFDALTELLKNEIWQTVVASVDEVSPPRVMAVAAGGVPA